MCALKLPLCFLDHVGGSAIGLIWQALGEMGDIFKPKKVESLGVLILRIQNIALLMKNIF
jgi:hypothetical protein